MMVWVLLSLAAITVLANLLFLVGWPGPTAAPKVPDNLPPVDVLVAARDEATHLHACLDALRASDYPAEKLTVWVGNDGSTDGTLALAQQYARQWPGLRVVDIQEQVAHLQGKANVLAQLARQAQGQYLLITDADVAVNPQWVRTMVALAEQHQATMVTGVSVVAGAPLGVAWQRLDWLLAWGLMHVVARWGKPITAAGNNMLVRRQAYQELGGYEALPFSITEDYALFKALRQRGGQFVQALSPQVKAYTQPVSGAQALLQQRKRWMSGAMQLPWAQRLVLFVQALFFPTAIALLVLHPALGVATVLTKVLSQTLFLRRIARSLSTKVSPLSLLTYEFYSATLSLSLIIYYFLPLPVQWKGRTYRV